MYNTTSADHAAKTARRERSTPLQCGVTVRTAESRGTAGSTKTSQIGTPAAAQGHTQTTTRGHNPGVQLQAPGERPHGPRRMHAAIALALMTPHSIAMHVYTPPTNTNHV